MKILNQFKPALKDKSKIIFLTGQYASGKTVFMCQKILEDIKTRDVYVFETQRHTRECLIRMIKENKLEKFEYSEKPNGPSHWSLLDKARYERMMFRD